MVGQSPEVFQRSMKIPSRTCLYYWLPVLALCVAIFVQSCFATPDLGFSFPLKDKMLHMSVYGLLAALFYRAWRWTWPGRFNPVQMLVASVLFAALYGVSDELHQAFVAARQADGYDVLADIAGSFLGAAMYRKAISRIDKRVDLL